MKLGFPKISFPDLGLPPINWFGLIAGALMLALPFMGFWWIGRAGTGAMEIGWSPFDINVIFMDTPLQSSLVGLFLLFAKIAFIIAGIFMILSSLFPNRWWSKRLFGFGAMKPFSQVVFFVVVLVICALAANILLPNLLSGMFGGTAGLQIDAIVLPIVFIVVFVVSIYAVYKLFSRLLSKISRETEKSQLKGNIILISIFIATLVAGIFIYQRIPPPSSGQVNLNIPYVSGAGDLAISIQNTATITAPIVLSLTGVFWVAVAVAALCIVARIYHRRFAPPEKILKPKVAVKPEKARPEKPKK